MMRSIQPLLRLPLALLALRLRLRLLLGRRCFILTRLVLHQLILIITDISSIHFIVPILPIITLTTLGEPILVLELVVIGTEALDIDFVIVDNDLVVILVLFLFVVVTSLGLFLLLGVQNSLLARDVGFLLLSPEIPRFALSDMRCLLCCCVCLCFVNCTRVESALSNRKQPDDLPNSWKTVSPSPFLLPTSPSTILTSLNSILGPISTNLTAFLEPFLLPRPT
jgi:hypothetical protein